MLRTTRQLPAPVQKCIFLKIQQKPGIRFELCLKSAHIFKKKKVIKNMKHTVTLSLVISPITYRGRPELRVRSQCLAQELSKILKSSDSSNLKAKVFLKTPTIPGFYKMTWAGDRENTLILPRLSPTLDFA